MPSRVAPLLALLLLGLFEPARPSLAYLAAKVALLGGLLGFLLVTGRLPELRERPRQVFLSMALGAVLLVGWILLDQMTPHFAFLGARSTGDPYQQFADPGERAVFLTLRLTLLVAVVPMAEEIFYRSFLLRYVTSTDFLQVTPGTVTPLALGFSALAFALSHPEWLSALGYFAALSWLQQRTRSFSACVLAHAVTNLALGVWVLQTKSWSYW